MVNLGVAVGLFVFQSVSFCVSQTIYYIYVNMLYAYTARLIPMFLTESREHRLTALARYKTKGYDLPPCRFEYIFYTSITIRGLLCKFYSLLKIVNRGECTQS